MTLEHVFFATMLALAVTLRSLSFVTSLAALAVALVALWQARKATRTVHEDVLPQLRAMTGDEPDEAT